MVDELHDDLPALLIPAPIGRDRTKGLSWDAEYTGDRIYVLNPSHSKPQTLQQLQFLGVFLGVAIRFVVSDADLFGSLSSVREPRLPHVILLTKVSYDSYVETCMRCTNTMHTIYARLCSLEQACCFRAFWVGLASRYDYACQTGHGSSC